MVVLKKSRWSLLVAVQRCREMPSPNHVTASFNLLPASMSIASRSVCCRINDTCTQDELVIAIARVCCDGGEGSRDAVQCSLYFAAAPPR